MALLGLLTIQKKSQRVVCAFTAKIDFYPIGLGDSESKLLCLNAHLVVVDGESGRKDDFVDSVKSCPAEAKLFCKGRQWGRRRIGRDTKDNIIIGINIF